MASGGPMRQSIPLADTVRALAGDAGGLARDLERERKALERELQKTLDSAGQLDGRLTQKLEDLRRRQLATSAYVDREAAQSGVRRDMMAVRGMARNVSGAAQLLSGRMDGGRNIQDVAELMSAAGGRLARSGYVGAGGALARMGGMVSAGVSTFVMPAMAAVSTAIMGFETGQWAQNKLLGDPVEMAQAAKRAGVYQEDVWSNRKKLGGNQTAFMLSQSDNPYAQGWLMRDTMRNGKKFYAQAERENSARKDFWYMAARPFRGNLAEEDSAWIKNRMLALAAEEKKKLETYRGDPSTIQDRAIANERLLAIKAAEDERFEARQTWAPW